MKRLLLACFLVAAGSSVALAQNANPATQGVTDNSKQLFTSKVSEWSAAVSRNRPEISNKVFSDIAGMMQNRIAEDNRALAAATSDAEKTTLKNKIKEEQNLYSEIKMLSTDVTKNSAEMKTKLMSFQKNY